MGVREPLRRSTRQPQQPFRRPLCVASAAISLQQ